MLPLVAPVDGVEALGVGGRGGSAGLGGEDPGGQVLGQALPQWVAPSGSRALAVVYARRRMTAGLRPAAASDWRCGATVAAGAPLCTVHAAAEDALAAMRRARATARRLAAAGSPAFATGDWAPDDRGFSYNAGEPSSGHRPSSLGRDHA